MEFGGLLTAEVERLLVFRIFDYVYHQKLTIFEQNLFCFYFSNSNSKLLNQKILHTSDLKYQFNYLHLPPENVYTEISLSRPQYYVKCVQETSKQLTW